MNVINLVGNLTTDVELKHSQGGTAYTSFNIGVQRAFKDKQSGEYKSDFPRCKAFGKTAEIISEHFGKGSKIGLTGSVQTDRYEKDGQTVYTTDIMVDRVHFVAPKAQNQGAQPQQNNYRPNTNTQQNQPAQGGYERNPFADADGPVDISDSDLPF